MEERNSNYQIEEARTGLPVPVINGVYLHSIYNPQKEAQTLAEKYFETLKHKNYVLVLGLGFGYHINEIASNLRKNFNEYQIIVIEPNSTLIEDFVKRHAFDDENIKIINTNSVSTLYHNSDFVNFLMQKPCVVKHEASFSINKEFFTNLLSYKAETNISDYKNLFSVEAKQIIDENVKDSIQGYIANLQNKRTIANKQEFLALAFNAIINR